MNRDSLTHLRAYWDKLRRGRLAPYRAELDPREFEDALEAMFILEHLGPEQIRVRLAGMALCEMMGMEVRGMPPEAFIAAEHRTAFSRHLNAALNGPCVVELDLVATDNLGGPVEAHMLLLPLRSDFGEVTRILGCVSAPVDDIRVPVNFAIHDARHEQIRPSKGADEPIRELEGFGESGEAYLPGPAQPHLRSVGGNPDAPTGLRRKGHLKLVSGND